MTFKACADSEALPPIPNTPVEVPWEEYQGLRNEVLALLRTFGSVGAMGDYPLGHTDAEEVWSVEEREPQYFVPDDQEDEWRKYIYVEAASCELISQELILSLSQLAGRMNTSIGVVVNKKKYFFLEGENIWFCDAKGTRPETLAEAIDRSVTNDT